MVSWKDAAEIKDSVARDAFVMPRSTGSAVARARPSASAFSFSSKTRARSICSPLRNLVSPGSEISTLRSIWRMMTSMCLSLIFTPCRR